MTESAKDRKKRANEWKQFRSDHRFTQRRLADIVGISRRTIQQVEGAKITPHIDTLNLFEDFQKKYQEASKLEYEVNWGEELQELSNG